MKPTTGNPTKLRIFVFGLALAMVVGIAVGNVGVAKAQEGTSTVQTDKDAIIADLRQQLAARDAFISRLQERIRTFALTGQSSSGSQQTSKVTTTITGPGGTLTATNTVPVYQSGPTTATLSPPAASSSASGGPMVAFARSRQTQGPSTIGLHTSRILAKDLAIVDCSAPYTDVPWYGNMMPSPPDLHYIHFDPSQSGQFIKFAFNVGDDATYKISTPQFNCAGQGMYLVGIDTTPFDKQMDFGDSRGQTLATLHLTAGAHTITFQSTGVVSIGSTYGIRGLAANIYAIDFLPAL